MDCQQHKKREISCQNCYTNEELEAEIAKLQATKAPPAPGAKKPKRSDDPLNKKSKRASWMDDLLND